MADLFFMSKVNEMLNVERTKLGLGKVDGEKGYPKNAQSMYAALPV